MRCTRLLALVALLIARPALSQAPAPSLPYKIPILQYHLIGDTDSRWKRSRDGFRRDLQLLYDRGYRPITVAQLVDRKLDIPRGTSPVVITFDDASPGQFSYIERNGKLEIDPNSAVGIWLDFGRRHRDWKNRATFCVLPAAAEGHAFFGDTGVAGQKTEWRFPKLRFLVQQGFELCNHTLWHGRLDRRSDAAVQEQIARGVLAVDSAVAGYRVRTFALPLGLWPKNRTLAQAGRWTDPRGARPVDYRFDAILEVTGALAGTPYGPGFNPLAIPRTQVIGDNLAKLLDQVERVRYTPK
ncbi:MAG: polysaccharide deacetylase family protein [Gemmatimonadaceae bacterium]|jgi:peptidoglycan/xylan/chitin deacetylase (PgdA/CDA1 family)